MQRGEDQVPGQRRLNGGARGLEIADFPDHHHVRVVTQDGAQARLEGHAHLMVDGDLVDALKMVFNGVLDGQHLERWAHDFVERRVECGGLAGASRAGHQNNPVRAFDQASESAVSLLIHAELGQGEKDIGFVEQTHDDALSEQHGDDRDADVDLPPTHVELDPSVLRDAPLGDVQICQDLDARNDRRLEAGHLRRH